MELKKRIEALSLNILLILLALNIFFIKGGHATGSAIYVDDSNISGPWDGTDNFPYKTIQEGIAAASSGDTIIVRSGTYNENVVITKNLTIVGDDRNTTFIDGGENGHVLYAYGTADTEIHVSISRFTIRNAGRSGFDCVAFSYVSTGEIVDTKILNSKEGEGISLDHCYSIIIFNNIIIGCNAAGISLAMCSENILENNLIQDNQNGIQLGYSSYNHITGNIIHDNHIYGIYALQNSSNNVFSLNDLNGDSYGGGYQNAKDLSYNTWSANGKGNYWGDYNKYDNNSDGIGDTPYAIPGGNNIDEYPLGYFKQPIPPGGGNQPPIAVSLSISKTLVNVGDLVSFTGQGTDTDGYIVGYQWRSSLNGTLSTKQSFSTSTLAIGTHTIYFKVQDNNGTWSAERTAIIDIYPLMNYLPTAYIDEIIPNPAQQGETVLFRGHGSDQDGTIIGYKWLSSKDGIIGTTSSFSIRNLSAGAHIIYFQVKDNTNDMSPSISLLLVIEKNSSQGPAENHLPIVNIGGPYQGNVNVAVSFNGSRCTDDDGKIISYIWDFGDNQGGTGVSPSHVYNTSGMYTVTLKVTDNEGANASAFTSVVISQSSSQGNQDENFAGFTFNLPLPILILIVVLVLLGIISGFLLRLRRR
jgi:parallel beta-helix repeat protein